MTNITPLTSEQLLTNAPSLFTRQKAESVSSRYTLYPTIDFVKMFQENGWIPVAAKQTRPHKKERTPFVKHLIRLIHPEMNLLNNTEYGMINIMNSHDGKLSYRIYLGMYRLVCSNGLVMGFDYCSMKLSHIKFTIEDVYNISQKLMSHGNQVMELSKQMKNISISDSSAFDIAFRVLSESTVYHQHEKYYTRIAEKYIQPIRKYDESDDLWTRYNVIQENMMRGVNYIDNEGATHRVRPIRSVDSDIHMNILLSNISASYIQ